MKKWYGSIDNRLDEGKTFGKVEVGMGATEMRYTDRQPFEVVEVIDDKHVIVRECDYKIVKGSECDGTAEYEYTLKPYEEYYLTKELLEDNYRMLMISAHSPKLYKKILSSHIGDKIGDNNRKLVLTQNGWRERLDSGKLGSSFTLGIKERYYEPTI